jgi:agmatinase
MMRPWAPTEGLPQIMTWDKGRLDALKAKYGDGQGGEIHDPKFRKVADRIFDKRGTRMAPYAGMPTFLYAPHRPIDPENPDFGDLQVALLGVPMDLGVTNRTGSRFGPRALRAIERIGPYNQVLECAPTHELRVADIGDVPFRSRYRLEQSHEDIETHVAKIVAAGVAPLAVGGDHSISHPILRAIGKDRPVGMIHIDAHCDTGGSFDGTKFHHGGPFRNAVLDGVLDPTRTVQIGIRGPSEYLWEFSYESGMTVIHTDELVSMGIPAVVRKALEVVGDGPTYLSFDIDSLDPAFAPGTGTPEVGGLTTREALELLRGFKGVNLVGGDMVEVAPQYDANTNTAHAGAQVLFEILSLMLFSPSIGGR